MDPNTVFKINKPVISENIDGEVVIINLDSGTYYSTSGIGTVLWGLIEQGHSLGRTSEALRAAYGREPEVDDAVQRFMEKLKEERLITARADRPTPSTALPDVKVNGGFDEPVLHKYEDMKDMLLLDPIHDVDDEAGWPQPKSD